ncbi:hypothetical protein SAMN05421870_110119 [Streptomyces qinglanensis]|uniref:Uncharacterized protein n=1 Tax=Streptomyces qinglanensis TaxID=943816 RepID=A0A1H9V3L2_9ACTN|nr:hypothetical protein SAMN05421870_110119 [Streptomyces qinglanensis]
MIVTLIVICEVAFWVLLAVGLALRYLAKLPRAGAAVLLCEPLLEVVLLIVTAIDLRNGAEPDWKHGLAAVYIGFTATHGHYMVRWADGHAAHLLGKGERPAKPPRYGMAHTVHEWKMCGRALGGTALAAVLLQAAIWYVDDASQAAPLREWQSRMGVVAGISLLIAVSYTIWPKRPKHAGRSGQRSGPTGPTGPTGLSRPTRLPERAESGSGTERAGSGAGTERAETESATAPPAAPRYPADPWAARVRK